MNLILQTTHYWPRFDEKIPCNSYEEANRVSSLRKETVMVVHSPKRKQGDKRCVLVIGEAEQAKHIRESCSSRNPKGYFGRLWRLAVKSHQKNVNE